MALLPTNDYVKFVRGSKSAFNALQNKADDTLYFIYDSADKSTGSLYLGSRLIGGTGSAAGSSLGDLKDIVISTIGDKQILIYNENNQSWENGSISDIISVDDKSIVKTTVGTLSLKNFATAEIKSLAYKKEDGDLGWITPIEAVTVLNVYTKDEINKKLNQSLTRKLVNSVNDIDVNASDAEAFIYLVPNASGTYDEYIVVNKKLEKVGDWTTNLDDYVTKAEVGTLVTEKVNTIVQEKIGDLSDFGGDNPTLIATIGNLSSFNAEHTLVDKVNEIDGRLKWSEITTD